MDTPLANHLEGRMARRRADQPGLRLRMTQEARRISSQHRQLAGLYALVTRALERRSPAQARVAFERFRDALDAHMSLENELYFPALHGLRPDLEAELAGLVREHRRFRRSLDRLAGSFGDGDASACSRGLASFAAAFAEHEQREERLMESIP
jgi:iron-sulfur cluster repair protein YtfE (RIC family)